MTKTARSLLGFASFAPFVCWLLLIVWLIAMILMMPANDDPQLIVPFFIIVGLMWLFVMGMLIFDIIYIFRSDQVPESKRLLWTVILIFAHLWALPVFWWFYIRPEPMPGSVVHQS